MSSTIRFPYPSNTAKHNAELSQIITILPPTSILLVGGEPTYVDVTPWKTVGDGEAPYTSIVVEFTANTSTVIGNGTTQRVGLFGEIAATALIPAANQRKFLLGVLGVNLGTAAPQIPIIARADAELVGFAQIVCDVAAYDRLSIGGISGDIDPGDPIITVRARPIRRRDYTG